MNAIITQKKCTKCGKTKSINEFVKDKTKSDGFYSSCKQCYMERVEEHKEQYAITRKKYKIENRDYLLAKKKEGRLKNREENLKKLAEYHLNNKEKEKEYRIKNRKKLNLASYVWGLFNKDRRRESLKKWRSNNPEKVIVQKNNRRALEGQGRITAEEWKAVLDKYGNKCLCCGKGDVKLTLDHVVPLCLGGANSVDNIQPLCKSCNSRKGKKIIDYRICTPVFSVMGYIREDV